MTKRDFLLRLQEKLTGLPQAEVEERLNFYSEMIEDGMEEGVTEEEAVVTIGTPDEVARQILTDIPLTKLIKESVKPKRRLTTVEIVLLVLGFPVWLPLLIAAGAIVFAVYVSLWSVIASLWAVFVSMVACALGVLVGGVLFAIYGNGWIGCAVIGAALVCAGLSVFLFFGCHVATGGIVRLTQKMALGIKHCFVRKGEA